MHKNLLNVIESTSPPELITATNDFIETSLLLHLQVDKTNESLREKIIGLKTKITSLEDCELHLKSDVSEKVNKIGRLEEEVQHYLNKIENIETLHKKEMDSQKERVSLMLFASCCWKIANFVRTWLFG